MRTLPPAARGWVAVVLLAAALCAAPALDTRTPWTTVAVLAVLYAVCELGFLPAGGGSPSAARRDPGGEAPAGIGSFYPVLLAAALMLPPSAAALVALPGSMVGRVARSPRWLRRCWRAGQLAVATFAAGHAQRLLDGERALRDLDFPYLLLPAAAAALTFCVVATTLVGGVLVTAERCPPRAAWGTPLLGSIAPHLTYGMVGLMMAALWRGSYGAFAAVLVLLPMYIACWVFAQVHREHTAHRATVRALVQAVEIKDRYTRGHSERVGRASVFIARELGMAEDRVDALRFAGILHDIGKIGVPTRLLRKNGPLTPEERRVIELHPEYGHEVVRGIAFLGEARAAILHHHERMDGSGYPFGLTGEQIPQFARVVAVADAFDAMTSTRSYRRARGVGEALDELRRCSGTHFDPAMVAGLVSALDRHVWTPTATADPSDLPLPGGPGLPPPRPGGRPATAPAPDHRP
ncbi:HD-GYP domain-containing protein [Streptomyces sp. NPDC006733]|uniref:HD-GYP domain-containing protein n=1 Tax=Streptomyces sp. NPDC006733 TaxID=3155460 RepID=UPI0033F47E6A